MRHYYYLDCEDIDGLFEYLDDQAEEGYIEYEIDNSEGIISTENLDSSVIDDIYKVLESMDLIEDEEYGEIIDEDYDDFFNEDDLET